MNIPKLLKQAEKLVSYGKTNEAINLYQEILSEDFQNTSVHQLIADLYISKKDFQRASRHLFKVAADCASLGDPTEAINVYRKILQILPKNVLAREKLLELYSRSGSRGELFSLMSDLCSIHETEGNVQKVIEYLEKLVSLDPSNRTHQMKLATFLNEKGLKERAVELFFQMSREFCRESRWSDALDVLEKIRSIDPKDKNIYIRIAEVYDKQGKVQRAIEVIAAALASEPSRIDLLSCMAKLHIRAGKIEEAEHIYERMIKTDRNLLVETLPFIEVLIAEKRLDQAIHHIERLCQELNDKETRKRCVDYLEEVLKLDPQNLDAYRLLEAFYSSLFQYDQLAITLLSHAEAYISKCDYARAVDLAKQLVDLEPYNQEYRKKYEYIEKLAAGGPGAVSTPRPATEAERSGEEEEGDVAGPVDTHFDQSVSIVTDEDVESFIIDIELLEKFGQQTAGIRRLEHVLKRYPQEIKLRQKLKTLYFDRKMPKKAAQECLEIAKILQAHDRKEEANKYIREAQRLNPLLSTAGRSSAPTASVPTPEAVARKDDEHAALKGDLSEISLLDIIQILDNAQKSGKLLIYSEGKEGTIFFNSGKIVNAAYQNKTAEPAMYDLVAVNGGTFVYKPSAVAFDVLIHNSNTNIILEGLRLLDEANRDSWENEAPLEEEPENPISTEGLEVPAPSSTGVLQPVAVMASSTLSPTVDEDNPLEEL